MRGRISYRFVSVFSSREGLSRAIHSALSEAGILARLSPNCRIALKPNFTCPHHTPGITTSPAFIWETVRVLRDYTTRIAIVESDGGYGAWSADEAFKGHDLYPLRDEFRIDLVNLCNEESEPIRFSCHGREYELPLPRRLLRETDIFITLPVPKVHCMTGLTLAYKNQWGCIPDTMRLRRHHVFDDAIVAVNKALKPKVLADGTYFLDRNGPMQGEPVRMDLIIAASDVGAFDRYVSELMGFSWRRVPHLRRAVALNEMPAELADITCNVSPADARTHTFHLERTLRSWIALAGFKSSFLTWLGYESWFGRVVLHSILYAIVGKPPKLPTGPDKVKVTAS